MDQETFHKLKKENLRAKAALCREHMNRAWFLCYQLTQDPRTAAPLLLSAWEKTFEEISGLSETPASSFRELAAANIFKIFQGGIQPDEYFSTLTKPQPAERFRFIVEEIQSVSEIYRPIYLMNVYGGLGKNSMAEITGLKPENIAEAVQKASQEISANRPKTTQQEWAEQMRLSAEFRSPAEEGFVEIKLPPRLAGAVEERLGVRISAGKTNSENQKRGEEMSTMIGKARRGDPESLKALYKANKGHILSLCQGLLGCAPDSETVTLQGGDPNGDGSGGSDTTITGEFSENGIENPLSNTRGAIAMARSDDYDSASSQFFIVHEDSTFLDGEYAVFGYVTSGMDIVDSICSSAEPTDDNGTIPSEQQPVIESITIRSPSESGEDGAGNAVEYNE